MVRTAPQPDNLPAPRRRLPRVLYALVARVVHLWRRTCRLTILDPEGIFKRLGAEPAVCVIWHNRLLFLPDCFPREIRRRTVVLASESRDGEHAAHLMQEFDFIVERGSSSRGGERALLRLKRHLARGRTVVLTVDGPRGPRYTVHPGAAVLAALSGTPIIPISLNARRRWELNSWDGTQLPKPFSRIELRIGPPLCLPAGARRAPEAACARIRAALMAITSDIRHLPPPDRLRWYFAWGVPAGVRRYIESGAWERAAERVKHNRRRAVYHVPPGAEHPGLFIKIEHPPQLVHRLRRRIVPKSRSEFRALELLQKQGILPCVRPLAWARSGAVGVLVTEEWAAVESFMEAWRRVRETPAERSGFLDALARFLARIRELRLRFMDLHEGNLLVSFPPAPEGREGAAPAFVLVDVIGLRQSRAPDSPERAAGWLTRLLLELPAAERFAFLARAGFFADPGQARRAWPKFMRRHVRQVHAHWPGRRMRLLQKSSLCRRIRGPAGRGLMARDAGLAPAALQAALTAVAESATGGAGDRPEILKEECKHRVSRVRISGGVSVIVKEYRMNCRLRGPWAPDRGAWLAHYRLARLGLDVPRALAWIRRPDHSGAIVMEDLGRANLADAARAGTARERRRMVRAAGILAARIFLAGVRCRDLKASNVMLRPSQSDPRLGVRALLIDLDAMRFGHCGSLRFLRRNLEQLHATLPVEVTARDRLFLLAACRRETGLDRQGFRNLLRGG